MSLRLKLMAAVLALAGAAAVVITLAGAAELRDYLIRQADQQLGAAAGGLAYHAQVAWPGEGAGPSAQARPYVEVFTPGGQPLMPLGQAAGPAVPLSPAWVRAHAGQPVTVPGRNGGQSWRVIAEPVHYQAHHILYVYGASDFSLVLTSRAVPGRPATLVVGVGLADVGQAAGKLITTGLAYSILIILAAAGLGAWLIRGRLRPLAEISRMAEAVAGGGLPRGADRGEPGSGFGRLARSVSGIASQAEEASRAQAEAESAADEARERLRQALVAALRQLREPVSVVTGAAEYYRQGGGRDGGEPGAMMARVAEETDRMSATVDALDEAGYSGPCSSA